MCSIVNRKNLLSGIEIWRQKKWDTDFHNCFYCKLRILLLPGLNENNWLTIVKHLSRWRATRGRTNDFIYQRGLDKLNNFNELIGQINPNTTIETASWNDLEPIFLLSHSINNVDSPVFASKLSHFLFPNLFPIIDNVVVGLNYGTYPNYWRIVKENWIESHEKEICKQILANAIGENVIEQYPWATKITEICLIGSNTR